MTIPDFFVKRKFNCLLDIFYDILWGLKFITLK